VLVDEEGVMVVSILPLHKVRNNTVRVESILKVMNSISATE